MNNILLSILYSLMITVISCKFIPTPENKSNPLRYCPSGMTAVSGNDELGISDFCVMRFEAKNKKGQPTSQPQGIPWATDAKAAQKQCQLIKIAGYPGQFALISNAEWMTIARDIEKTDGNWLGKREGQHPIVRGHSDGQGNCGRKTLCQALSVKYTDNHYDQTGDKENGLNPEQRRTHYLSNGSIIWDFAGNLWEWVDWSSQETGFTPAPGAANKLRANIPPHGEPLTAIASHDPNAATNATRALKAQDVLPSPTRTPNSHQHSLGRLYDGEGLNAVRGGDWNSGQGGGVFALSLNRSGVTNGFRCVYRP